MKKTIQTRDVLPSAGKIEEREDEISFASEELVGSIRPLIEQAKARVAQSVNSELVMLYWQIGKRISEDLPAENRAEYDPLCRGLRQSQDSPDTVWTVVVVPFH